ncbi:aldo/keto reductase [Pacificoceanicola onchidii]|uniref:aldo/keto reductase n=1 Tax=Pacificoceanicola onchidii TaxID=2562685 RepID=UPI0010A5CC7A|nr:aldo/keto reductase [Pacificoceanicola onchidii]
MSVPSHAIAHLLSTVAGSHRIGIGCMALTGLYGRIAESDARDVLDRAMDLDFRLFDTAPLYTDGQNEELIGDVIGSKAGITVSTKFGLSEDNCGKLVRDSRPSSIRASVEASLRRLRRERIDILIQHRPDPDVNDQEVAGTVQDLIDAGKVASFGLSGTSVNRIKPMSERCSVTVVQNELSVLSDPNSWCTPQKVGDMGVFFMAYAPFARGLLSQKKAGTNRAADDYRAQMKAFQNPEQSAHKRLRECIEDVASAYGVSATAVMLAWAKSRGENVVPIPGPRHKSHLANLIETTNLEIQDAQILTIDEIASNLQVG